MTRLRLLVVEGNTADRNDQIRAEDGEAYAELYGRVLQEISPDTEICVARPCETPIEALRDQVDLARPDGVVWTGSSLNAYDDRIEIRRQVDFFGQLFDAGLPIFGSCWGLQVMTVALGGRVRRNPWGRELGIARDIELTPAGAEHPMFRGKPARFEALTTHVDEVEQLPLDCVVLASNAASAVQAVVIDLDGRSFWGVQYHPEFDLEIMTQVLRRARQDLVAERFFPSLEALESACRSFAAIHAEPGRSRPARSIFGISESVAEASTRRIEISNWLDHVRRRLGDAS